MYKTAGSGLVKKLEIPIAELLAMAKNRKLRVFVRYEYSFTLKWKENP